VIYTGAAPNQHIVPLADYLLREFGKTAYFVGSNYIWAWENNKIMREAVQDAGGQVIAERYLPVSEVDVADIVTQVLDGCPSFVFNTLIGDSAYAFFRRIRQAAAARSLDQPKVVPIASCSLAEPELVEIGPEACDGHISSSVYFESVAGATNQHFVADYRARFPHGGPTSADVESSYIAVQLLARALRRAGRTDMPAVRAAVQGAALQAPQGRVHIDRDNRHCYLTPRIGVSTRAGGFDIIYEADGPVKPDPYLVWSEWQKPAVSARPHLRVVK
jgi:branched-chain amino acid transport system substrate-binding protein